METRQLQNAILLGALIVLCYLAGYTVGEFNAYWHQAESEAQREIASRIRRARDEENKRKEIDGREKE